MEKELNKMKNTKKFHIIMAENDHRQLKVIAAQKGLTIGEVIRGLLKFAQFGKYMTDKEQQMRFNGLLDTCMLNATTKSGWKDETVKAGELKNQKE